MYQRILVALDNSPASEQVFTVGLTLAKSWGSQCGTSSAPQLMLLHVLSENASDSPVRFVPYATGYDIVITQEYQKEWQKFQRECEEKLKNYQEKAEQEGVKTDYTQVYGSPGSAICHFASEWKTDLIVIGRRGQSKLSEILLGSVSSYVIHRSHCCIHLVQSGS
ncbi:universal stress protein [Gloeothece verrucosa]|uniref:UspA domain protein n=1 Tax=Gloeothece verrucosa (strain PCC 7822) TaxID=497965 RepID=E0U8N3_GLOV7|nr:universal stress protein [Gloeothece verrucosa]ADN13779.1 UspA domain protein [Gloeothece verrucosa PCC 7822]